MTLNLLDIKHRDSNAQKGNTTQKTSGQRAFQCKSSVSVHEYCLCVRDPLAI